MKPTLDIEPTAEDLIEAYKSNSLEGLVDVQNRMFKNLANVEGRLFDVEASIEGIDNDIMYKIVTDAGLTNEAQRKAAKKKIEQGHQILKGLKEEEIELKLIARYLDLLLKQANRLMDNLNYKCKNAINS